MEASWLMTSPPSLPLPGDVLSADTKCPINETVLMHFPDGRRQTSIPPTMAHQSRAPAYVTPSYRLLPESTGSDALDDAVDAAKWVAANITPRVVIAGSSAGGYLAVATAAQLTTVTPKPLAVLSVYGMLDLAHRRYLTPGTSVMNQPSIPHVAPLVDQIAAAKGVDVKDAYPFPAAPAQDRRMHWIAAVHQEALFPDLLAGVPGMARKIAEAGVEAVEPARRRLFPLAFGAAKGLPPTALLHGTEDSAVGVEQSVAAAAVLEEAGVEVLLRTVPGREHWFGLRELSPDADVEATEDAGSPVVQSLRDVIQFLDSAVARSQT
ncbi:Alpha/Beta hydrolase protein [Macrophomina phaseolina]|uniref:Alpha/Beta hydrolase protein n=1 Tax=Macrophomina phaseolina TaxID=35725 RepID=A0ABQ8GUE3_9PEZI|nr:Alpha/Beta hydrolase protein [Macrophomina phaseolina]